MKIVLNIKLKVMLILFLKSTYCLAQEYDTLILELKTHHSIKNNIGEIYFFDQLNSSKQIVILNSQVIDTLIYKIVIERKDSILITLKSSFDSYHPFKFTLFSNQIPDKIQYDLIPYSDCEISEITYKKKKKRKKQK